MIFKNEQEIIEILNEYEGFFKVSGYVEKCKYPIILKSPSSIEYANGERITNVWIPSYELREALRSNELKIDFEKLLGYVWKPDGEATNPFKDYVEHFYSLKNNSEKNSPLYLANKLLLNALYGKTYQAIKQTDFEEEPEYVWNEVLQKPVKNKILYRAGGLYLPHVGSWITSLCRAKLHEDLHKYEAIDCATDSFKTLHTILEGNGLGDKKLVCQGLLLLIRSKLYVMFSEGVQKEVMQFRSLREWLKNIRIEDLENGKDIVRYALHGFWGNVHNLLELYRDKKKEYFIKHMTKIREAIRQRKQARIMEMQTRALKIDWSNERGLCGMPVQQALKTLELCNLSCFTCAHP